VDLDPIRFGVAAAVSGRSAPGSAAKSPIAPQRSRMGLKRRETRRERTGA
jgi:hypothetical protein